MEDRIATMAAENRNRSGAALPATACSSLAVLPFFERDFHRPVARAFPELGPDEDGLPAACGYCGGTEPPATFANTLAGGSPGAFRFCGVPFYGLAV